MGVLQYRGQMGSIELRTIMVGEMGGDDSDVVRKHLVDTTR